MEIAPRVRRLGTDTGLTIRMFLTMFLLALVYLAFIGFLWWTRVVGAGFIIAIAVVLLAIQYYFSDRLILYSIGAREVGATDAPELHDIVGRLAQLSGLPMPKLAPSTPRPPMRWLQEGIPNTRWWSLPPDSWRSWSRAR